VSRGRKPKKSAKRSSRTPARTAPQPTDRPESALAILRRTFGSKERPAWFDDAIGRVLDGADALVTATGPRELEQLTSELIGAELHRALHDVREGLRFDWWFAELADATRRRLDQTAGGDTWRPAYWLLHGLAAIATPALVPTLPTRGFVKALHADPAPPGWLFDATRVAATGDVWRMRDASGTRYAVIARFAYPHDNGRHVLLLDIDTSGFIGLADVGIFDDEQDAAAAWRETVGGSAAEPEPVTDPDQLLCVVHLDADEFHIRGDEARPVTDNWFRSGRRIHELYDALRKRGMPLPQAANLYHDIDVSVMTRPFIAWCAATGATQPDPESVAALAEEWMEGRLPETWFSVSPGRVRFQLELIGDWIADDVTTEVLNLMPTWVRWLGERGGLAEPVLDRAIAAATPSSASR